MIDAISFIKPVREARGKPGIFHTEVLRQDATRCMDEFEDVVVQNGIELQRQEHEWSAEKRVVHTLPTDLVMYFTHEIDSSIAPEIGEALLDGRVHVFLVLTRTKLPREQSWYRNFRSLPSKAKRSPSGILITSNEMLQNHNAGVQLHFQELKPDMRYSFVQVLEQVLQLKESA